MNARIWVTVIEFIPLYYKDKIFSLYENLSEQPEIDKKKLDIFRYRLFWQTKYALSSAIFREQEIFQFDVGNALLTICLQGLGWAVAAVSKVPKLPENFQQEEEKLLNILRKLVAGIPLHAIARIIPKHFTKKQLHIVYKALRKKHYKCTIHRETLKCSLPSTGQSITLTINQDLYGGGLALDTVDTMLDIGKTACTILSTQKHAIPAANWVIPERRTLTLLITDYTSIDQISKIPHNQYRQSAIHFSEVHFSSYKNHNRNPILVMPETNMLNGRAYIKFCIIKKKMEVSSDILSDFQWHIIYLWSRHCILTHLHFKMEDAYAIKANMYLNHRYWQIQRKQKFINDSPYLPLFEIHSIINKLDHLASVDSGKFRSYIPRYKNYSEVFNNKIKSQKDRLYSAMEFLLSVSYEHNNSKELYPYKYLCDSPIPISHSNKKIHYNPSLKVDIRVAMKLIREMRVYHTESLSRETESHNEHEQKSNLIIQLLIALLASLQISMIFFQNNPIITFLFTLLFGIGLITLFNRTLIQQLISRIFSNKR